MTTKKTKALVLFSGGLDSRLAIKLLQEQNLDVEAVFVKLPFGGGCCNNFSCIFNFSQVSGAKLHTIDATKGELFQEYIEIIRNPKHGRGTALNPCKDCKVFLFKKAKELADEIDAEIIATGEVLDQRPMSQLKHALMFDEKKAGLENKILRPLSGKILPPTDYEKEGLIDREKMLDIQGRQRKVQMKLAEKYKIKYPMPGGGCLLCEKAYCKKIAPLFEKPKITEQDIDLTTVGRYLNKGDIILGRNEDENTMLEAIQKKYNQGILIIPLEPGPTAFIQNKKYLDKAKEQISKYSKQQTKGFEIKEI